MFTSFLYKIAVFLLIPLAVTGIGLYMGGRVGMAGVILAAMLLPPAEILSDYWLFGGIQARDPAKMDYLKTSGRGMWVMKNGLSMDLIRKLLSGAVVLIFSCTGIWLEGKMQGGTNPGQSMEFLAQIPGGEKLQWIWFLILMIGIAYFFSVLGTFLSRYGNMLWINMITGYAMMVLEILCQFLPGLWSYIYVYIALFAVLGLAVSLLTVRTGMKKVRRGYHD